MNHIWTEHADVLGRPRLRCANCRALFAAKLIREECVPPKKRGGKLSELIPRCEPRPTRLKRCRTCERWLPIGGNFDRKSSSPDFHSGECKSCKRERRHAKR